MKQTIIQCVTALVCVIAICVTSSLSIGNLSTAKVEAAKKAAEANANAPTASGDVVDPSGDVVTDPATDVTAVDPATGDPVPVDPSTGATDVTAAGGTTAKPGTTTKAGSSVPSTPAAIATYYNTAINKVISSKAGYKKNRVTTLSNLNGGALLKMSIVVNTVNDFLGVGTTPYENKKGKAEFMAASSLKASDITNPVCTNSNGVYTITMNLKNGKNSASAAGNSDTTALGRCGLFAGNGDKKAYDYKNSLNLYKSINGIDNASVESISESISGAKITAKIDSKTGNLISLTIGYNWSVALTNVKYTIVTIKSATGDAVTTTTFSNFQF